MNKLISAFLCSVLFFTNLAWSSESNSLEQVRDKYILALNMLNEVDFDSKQDLLRQQLKVSSLANEYFSTLKRTNFNYSEADFSKHTYEFSDYTSAAKFSSIALNSLEITNKKLHSSEIFDLKLLNLKSMYLDVWHKKKAGKKIKSKLDLSFFNELVKESILREDSNSHFQLEEDLTLFILDLPNINDSRELDIWYESNVNKEIVRLNYHNRQRKYIKNKKFTLEYERLKSLANQVKLGNYNFNNPGKSYFYLGQYYLILGKFKIAKEFMEESIKYSRGDQVLMPIFKMANLYMLNITEGIQQDSTPYWQHTAMGTKSEIIYKPFMYYDFGLIKEDMFIDLHVKINEKGYVFDIEFINKDLDKYVRSFIEQIIKKSRFSPYEVNGELKENSLTIEFIFNRAYNKPKNKAIAKNIQLLRRYYPKSILHFQKKSNELI